MNEAQTIIIPDDRERTQFSIPGYQNEADSGRRKHMRERPEKFIDGLGEAYGIPAPFCGEAALCIHSLVAALADRIPRLGAYARKTYEEMPKRLYEADLPFWAKISKIVTSRYQRQ